MALRILEVYHPPAKEGDIEALLKGVEVVKMWHEKISAEESFTKILLPADETGQVLNIMEKKYGKSGCFRIIILPVEASLPRHKSDEKGNNENNALINVKRISIEEIYQKMVEAARPSYTFYIFIILASIVASIGLINNDTAVVIGSMVIAPLISPNMALALATTLADNNLIRRSFFASITAYIIVFVIGMTFGELFTVDPTGAEIFTRIDLNLFYVLIALCSGVAGALSLTRGVSQLLVGVMAAVESCRRWCRAASCWVPTTSWSHSGRSCYLP